MQLYALCTLVFISPCENKISLFNTFQQSWRVFMHSVCLSVCLSVRALTLKNILQMSWIWYMLFISDIAWTVLKMVNIRLMVCLQRHTKVFRYITVYLKKNSKRILTCLYCNKWNKINIWHSGTQKHFVNKKWFKCHKYFVYSLTQNFLILIGEMFKVYFNIFTLH